jgi:hypothetical protein
MVRLTRTFAIFAVAAFFAAGSAIAVKASIDLAQGVNLSTLPIMR